jgi:hypothetical protein
MHGVSQFLPGGSPIISVWIPPLAPGRRPLAGSRYVDYILFHGQYQEPCTSDRWYMSDGATPRSFCKSTNVRTSSPSP